MVNIVLHAHFGLDNCKNGPSNKYTWIYGTLGGMTFFPTVTLLFVTRGKVDMIVG
jgi:hypothetical protein